MDKKQWKILIRFMRFTMICLFHLSFFKTDGGIINYGETAEKLNQFMIDTQEEK